MRNGIYFEVVLRHLGLERRMAVLKVKWQDFYAFAPYCFDDSADTDFHISYHETGERHAKSIRRHPIDGKMRSAPGVWPETVVHFKPPEYLRGAVQIYLSGDPLGLFRGLKSAYRGMGEQILIDVEKAGFLENPFVMKIYVVERGNEGCIPHAPDGGPRVLHFIRSTNPWIAIDVYQPSVN